MGAWQAASRCQGYPSTPVAPLVAILSLETAELLATKYESATKLVATREDEEADLGRLRNGAWSAQRKQRRREAPAE